MRNFITKIEPRIVYQMKTLGNKTAEMKNYSDSFIIRLRIPRERIKETKDRSIEMTHFEHKEKKMK